MRMILVLSAALALSGCATVAAGVETICQRQAETRVALALALRQAEAMVPSIQRDAALSAVLTALSALERCPKGL